MVFLLMAESRAPVRAKQREGDSKLSCSTPIGDAGSFSLCVGRPWTKEQRGCEPELGETLLTIMQQRYYWEESSFFCILGFDVAPKWKSFASFHPDLSDPNPSVTSAQDASYTADLTHIRSFCKPLSVDDCFPVIHNCVCGHLSFWLLTFALL